MYCKNFSDEIHSRGNALFLILMAVAIFAALSYAVTSSGRGSGSINKELAELTAAQMISYAGTVEHAVSRLLLGNCSAPDSMSVPTLSAYWPDYARPANYGPAPTPSTEECFIFYPGGGGVTWQRPPTAVQAAGGTEYLITYNLAVWEIGTSYTGLGDEEISIVTRVPKEICTVINRKMNVTTSDGNPPIAVTQTGNFAIPSSAASKSQNEALYSQGDGVSSPQTVGYAAGYALELRGKWTGCYQSGSASGPYYFYHVLRASTHNL